MTVNEAFDAISAASKAISTHFGLEIAYELVDFRGHPWMETPHGEILWWYDSTPSENIDPEDPMFSEDPWRNYRWETDEYTLFYVYQNGYKEARVYENACKLQGDFR